MLLDTRLLTRIPIGLTVRQVFVSEVRHWGLSLEHSFATPATQTAACPWRLAHHLSLLHHLLVPECHELSGRDSQETHAFVRTSH